MLRIGNQWVYEKAESQELLHAIFPYYPGSLQCQPVPRELYPPDNPNCKFTHFQQQNS